MSFQKIIYHTRNWYARFERPISSLSLVGGFIFDAVTLRRVDMFWDNFWVVAHLVIVAVAIVLINTKTPNTGDETDPAKIHFWLVNVLQFFFGGLLSTYLVFYFRSGTLSASWPFILLLTLAFWANEALKRHYARLSFQVSLFYLCLFSFSIFFIPVLVHKIGISIFLLSGLLSLICMWLFLAVLFLFTKGEIRKQRNSIRLSVGSVFLIMNILYFTHLIPPIPLSLKDGGVYHTVVKDANDNYLVTGEKINWLSSYFYLYNDFHVATSDPVYIYSAVFSPPDLNTTIVHQWQYYDAKDDRWLDDGGVILAVTGGRDGGFRTYSMKTRVALGRWRVNVQTTTGQIIGTIRFTVVQQAGPVVLQTEVK